MNFTDQMDDVTTLAHELGHGDAVPARRRAPDRPLAPSAAGARRGALDVRRDDRHSTACWRREPTPAGAPRRWSREQRRDGRSRRSSARRAWCATSRVPTGCARRARRSCPTASREVWFEDEPAVLRRRRRAAGGLPLRLGLHPALHPHALLHLRVRVRAPREPGALRAVPRGRRRVRRPVPRLPGDRRRGLAGGAARRHRPRHLARRRWDAGFAEIERMVEVAEAG